MSPTDAAAIPAEPPPARRRYPRSFFRFLILAFVIVCSPLALALLQLTLEASSLADGGSLAVRKVAGALQDLEALERAVTQIERVTRQAQALGEPVAADALASAREQFMQASVRLLEPELPPELLRAMREMAAAEARLHTRLAGDAVPAELPPEIEVLNDTLQALGDAANRMAAREVAALQQGFEQARHHTVRALAVALPLAVLLAAAFTVALSRPLARIEDAIRSMGRGDLERPVSIGGPADVRLLGARLDWLRQRLRELEGHRELLTRSISHDLKTPLTSMIEGIELLCQGVAGALNPRQTEVVAIMRDSATLLSDRIEELLTVRATAQRDGPVALRPVQLRALVQAVVARHQLVARGRGLDIRVLGEDVHVSADRSKLFVVLDNLLSNAIRFSPAGGVVEVALAVADGQALVTVADQGPGIPAADADRIFDPGYRGAHQPDQHVPGSGLGLSIAREFALAHGGTLRVLRPERAARSGAQLCLTLPSLLPALPGTAAQSPTFTGPDALWHTPRAPQDPPDGRG